MKGKQEAVSAILETRFGSAAASEVKKVHLICEEKLPDDLLKQILIADSLEDTSKIVEKATEK
ncbi:hypothetical protein [Bacillus piscicola]|uniref:hypothetical protein n=1 Tax=Bacillus piscicola TaxID=1632684 RepID=UPI001F09D01B|nr:hypothetical protein [Bacillus piscicola]